MSSNFSVGVLSLRVVIIGLTADFVSVSEIRVGPCPFSLLVSQRVPVYLDGFAVALELKGFQNLF